MRSPRQSGPRPSAARPQRAPGPAGDSGSARGGAIGVTTDDLLLVAASGDTAAFTAWYDATCGPAYRLAMCLDREQAEDLLRRAYVEAWRAAATYDPAHTRSLTWLLALLRRVGGGACGRSTRHRCTTGRAALRPGSALA